MSLNKVPYPRIQLHAIAMWPLIIIATLAGPGQAAHATRDGNAGAQSRGLVTVSLTIEPSVSVSAASHINLRISNRSVDTNYSELFCVQGNGGGKYTIIAYNSTGTPGEQSFTLRNDEGSELLYHVAYRGDVSIGFAPLAPNVSSAQYNLQTHCGIDSNFRVTFRADDLQRARSGLYAGSLTLVVRPV